MFRKQLISHRVRLVEKDENDVESSSVIRRIRVIGVTVQLSRRMKMI